jgi:hypothetical protein
VPTEYQLQPSGAHSGCGNARGDYGENVNWQDIVAISVVATTAGLLLWGRFRKRRFNFQRDTHCGCTGSSDVNAGKSVVFHARRDGERKVIMKMR